MKLLKPLLLLVVVIGLAGAGYLYFSKSQPNQPAVLGASSSSLPPATTSFSLDGIKQGLANALNQDKIGTATSLATEELGTLKDRGLALKEHLGVVLDQTQASGSASPQERALEYGQYLYCQGVVEEWERSNE